MGGLGLLHRHETRPFAQVSGPLADHAERFLLALSDELRGHRLRHQANQALENIAYLHIAAGRLTSFALAATKLGSVRWMPIVALAQAAITRARPDIARDVFAAADRPGLQRGLSARALHRANRRATSSHALLSAEHAIAPTLTLSRQAEARPPPHLAPAIPGMKLRSGGSVRP